VKKLVKGEGNIGKLINDETLYNTIQTTVSSLQKASANAQIMMGSLSSFSSKLNQKGTLANQLVTDTIVFNSFKKSVVQIQQVADSANRLVSSLKASANNPNSPVGVLLHDEQAGADLKEMIKSLESGSKKLDEDLEALQHSFLLRKYFKKKDKTDNKDSAK
jgi:phospholipid/cholesterol/gamma-HCH transport system substrate-binding protein